MWPCQYMRDKEQAGNDNIEAEEESERCNAMGGRQVASVSGFGRDERRNEASYAKYIGNEDETGKEKDDNAIAEGRSVQLKRKETKAKERQAEQGERNGRKEAMDNATLAGILLRTRWWSRIVARSRSSSNGTGGEILDRDAGPVRIDASLKIPVAIPRPLRVR